MSRLLQSISRAFVVAAATTLVPGLQVVGAADSGPAPAAAAVKPALLPGPMVEDETGFKPIFDGQTLHGWDGDPRLWRVENGEIVGEFTQQTVQKEESFLIWRGGKPEDFELRGEYELSDLGKFYATF